jgi:flagellar motor switch protein FliN/FliY
MNDDDLNQDKMAAQWAAAMAAEQASEHVATRRSAGSDATSTQADYNAEAGSVAAAPEPAEKYSIPSPDYPEASELDVILDISVRLTMELGSREISIGDLLQLKQGSVLELDQVVGQPLDVMVNGTLVAQGEVVQVNDKYGIRMLDIISQSERIKRLK